MNEGKCEIFLTASFVLLLVGLSRGESVRTSVQEGNVLYGKGNFSEAIDKYDQALVESASAVEPRFNKANSYYRLDDLEKAMELYREVAARSRDMSLVAKARYNLGNSRFQQGLKQRDSNLQKAVEELQTSIGHWRQVLDIEPENAKAARNIEVARLTIKDIIDQINKQKDPNQPQNPNQSQQQQDQTQDPNQGQNQQQATRDANEPQDPNQSQEQQSQEPRDEDQSKAPEETADEILEKERQERKERQLNKRARYRKVEKDW